MDASLHRYLDRVFKGGPCVLMYEDMFDESIKVVCVDGSNVIPPPFNEGVFDSLMEVFVSVSTQVLQNDHLRSGEATYAMTCHKHVSGDEGGQRLVKKSHADSKSDMDNYVSCILEYTDKFFVAYMDDYKNRVVKIYSKNMSMTENKIDLTVAIASEYIYGVDEYNDEDFL